LLTYEQKENGCSFDMEKKSYPGDREAPNIISVMTASTLSLLFNRDEKIERYFHSSIIKITDNSK
jgi:hypothetical protein